MSDVFIVVMSRSWILLPNFFVFQVIMQICIIDPFFVGLTVLHLFFELLTLLRLGSALVKLIQMIGQYFFDDFYILNDFPKCHLYSEYNPTQDHFVSTNTAKEDI